MKKIRLPLWVCLLSFGPISCAAPAEEPAPAYKVTLEHHSNLVLYTPTRYAVTATFGTSTAGFRLEDVKHETLAAVLETSPVQLNLTHASSEDVTSAAFANFTLTNLTQRIRDHITEILPLANPDESVGDWSLTQVNRGITHDIKGNYVAYGQYMLQVAPIYRLRSVEVFRFLAGTLVGASWPGFPKRDNLYFPAGGNTVELVIAVSIHNDIGYANDSDRVGVSFAAFPDNKSNVDVVSGIDDVLAFKTLGHRQDKLVRVTNTFQVGKRGEPIDFLFAIDANKTMAEEAPALRASLVNLVGNLYDDSKYNFHIGFITNGNEELVRFADGSRFLTPDSKKPNELAGLALDEIWSGIESQYTPRNDLLRRSVLAITEPVLSAVNKGFHRGNAPLLLVYISDRDDESPTLDNKFLPQDSTFAVKYANWLKGYTNWIAYAPSASNCKLFDFNTALAATNLLRTTGAAGATVLDMCSSSPDDLNDEILQWGDDYGSTFRFAAPQPMEFSLRVSSNGSRLANDRATGFNYDFLDDRLLFAGSVAPKEGDEIGVSYLTLLQPVGSEKR